MPQTSPKMDEASFLISKCYMFFLFASSLIKIYQDISNTGAHGILPFIDFRRTPFIIYASPYLGFISFLVRFFSYYQLGVSLLELDHLARAILELEPLTSGHTDSRTTCYGPTSLKKIWEGPIGGKKKMSVIKC